MCSTSTPVCWSVPAAWLLSTAAVPSPALPIIETQAGDVSAYIPPTSSPSPTASCILESNLFLSGVRPAVNVGLSVSRVGGAAQTKAVKKIAGSLRIDLAQFRSWKCSPQFSSDLDPATKRGFGTRQPAGGDLEAAPVPSHERVPAGGHPVCGHPKTVGRCAGGAHPGSGLGLGRLCAADPTRN